MTMRNPITKLAVAAAIAVACAAGIVVFAIAGVVMWTGTGSGVALADVLTQVQQITAYMYQMTMTVSGEAPGGQPMNQNVQADILIAQDYGMKMTMRMADPNGGTTTQQEQYMLPQENAIIVLMPAQKKYIRMEFDDTLAERMRRQNNDPGSMLEQVLRCKYQSLGRSRINGVEVEGFQTTDPNYLAGMMGQVDVRIWVDVKTRLPVRMTLEMELEQMEMHAIVNCYEWDVPVDAATFQPVIPADYTAMPGGTMKMPSMDEQGAIAGLKVFADLTGRYPKKLDLVSLMSELGKIEGGDAIISERLDEEGTRLTEDERANKLMDVMMPIQGAGIFYMLLTQEKKEPAYHGDVITPEDADKVLMRWKVSDTEYRVLFGSLHAETVDAATLAELEKTIPK